MYNNNCGLTSEGFNRLAMTQIRHFTGRISSIEYSNRYNIFYISPICRVASMDGFAQNLALDFIFQK